MTTTHHQVQQLLPWYVNGSLNEADMNTVIEHLERCAVCKAEVDQEVTAARSLHAGADRALDSILAGEQQSFDRLLARLPGRPPAPRRRLARPLLTATAAATALALAVLIPLQPDRATSGSGAVFDAQTATPPVVPTPGVEPIAAGAQGPVLQVVFKPETPEEQIRALLIDTGSTLLGNPTPQGVYRITVGSDEAARALSRLRDDPAVRWVEEEL